MKSEATLFVVDDDASVRKALSRLLGTAGYKVEVFESAEAFLGRDVPAGAGCLVLDLKMPRLSGLELQTRLERLGSVLPIVFLTAHGGVPDTVRAMKQGAVNFLLKPVDDEVLLAAIGEALERQRVHLAEADAKHRFRQKVDTLSVRECETMRCVISGAMNKEIADRLKIAEKTVKIHRGRVMQKLGVGSVAELVRLCALVGIEPTPVHRNGSVWPR